MFWVTVTLEFCPFRTIFFYNDNAPGYSAQPIYFKFLQETFSLRRKIIFASHCSHKILVVAYKVVKMI